MSLASLLRGAKTNSSISLAASGATVLIDRHYTALSAYRQHERNLYAVRSGRSCVIKYVEKSGNTLVMRPHSDTYPTDAIGLSEGEKAEDFIAGRVCHIAMEA